MICKTEADTLDQSEVTVVIIVTDLYQNILERWEGSAKTVRKVQYHS